MTNYFINKTKSKKNFIMANFMDDSIDMKVFMAIKACEVSSRVLGSPLQPLLMSSPGMGKSTAVQLYAEACGYKLVLLKGNSTEPGTVQGLDCAPTDTTKEVATKHLRPVWFQEILDNHERGEKTLLFLDEISTANEFVQAALLHLILERKCGAESLPESTLIVSAANYSSNLSNTMVMLPPLLNRFMIINIIPSLSDVSHFLSRYKGSLIGRKEDFKGKIKGQIDALNSLEQVELIQDEDKLNKIAELFESYINDEVYAIGGEGLYNPAVGDLQNLYTDIEGDQPLPGFITMRTLNFYRDLSIASYLAFGKAGLKSKNFYNMTLGLVGQALNYDRNKELVKNDVTSRFCSAVIEAANEADKLTLSKIPSYNSFISEVLEKDLTPETCNILANKVKELLDDPETKSIDRPLNPEIVSVISKTITKTLTKAVKDDVEMNKALSDCISNNHSLEGIDHNKFIGRVVEWNSICSLMRVVYGAVVEPSNKYSQDSKSEMMKTKKKCREYITRLKSFNKGFSKVPGIGELIPAIDVVI